MPLRMIRAEHFVLRTLPAITSLNPIILVVGYRRNLLRLWLRTEVRVLRFDLLHLLWSRLLRLGPRIGLDILLAGSRTRWSFTCRCRTSSCLRLRTGLLHPFRVLFSLMLCTGRRRSLALTGNIRFGGARRFRIRWSLSALSCTGLIRSSAFLHGSGLIRSFMFFHRSVLLRSWRLRLGRIWLGLRLSRVRLLRGVLAL